MAGHPQVMPLQIPGHHPGQQMHLPQANPMHGHLPHQHIQQPPAIMLPYYIGFELVPTTLPDGKQTWENAYPQQMKRTQEELAEIVKKDKNKVKDVYNSNILAGTKKRQIDRILNDHQRMERDPSLEWKLANIKLTEKDLVSGLAKFIVNKVTVTSMRVILKKVLRKQPKVVRSQSFPLPVNTAHMSLNSPIGLFPQNDFNRPQGQLFGEGMLPMNHGGHNAQVPLGRMSGAAEVISDDEFDGHHKEGKKDKDKKGKGKDKKKNKDKDRSRDRSESPDFRVPNVRDRRDSKSSSKLTAFSYDSDALSPMESPVTSLSSSPRHWHESKRRSSQLKKYHSRKDSDYSRRERRASIGSNDSFVMVSKGHSRGKHGGSTSSYRSNSIEHWSRGISPDRRHRDSHQRDDYDSRALVRGMERMRVAELERKTEDKRDLQHRIELNDRLRRLEDTVIHQDLHTRHSGRPSYGRARSDRASIGFMPNSRHEDLYLWR